MKASKGNFPKADLNKMELSLKFFVDLFYKLETNFAGQRKLAQLISAISEDEIKE
jgi:hypothetical protein